MNTRDSVLADRNRIFWIISDIVLQVKGEERQTQNKILCQNLAEVCHADLTFLFLIDIDQKTLELLGIHDPKHMVLEKPSSITYGIRENISLKNFHLFKKRNILTGNQFNIFTSMVENASNLSKEKINKLSEKYKHYYISTIRSNHIVIGVAYLPLEESLKSHDLISTYINLAGMIIQDTESIQMLTEANEKLNELNATKDKFFSIISHDLKNPFNAIMGFSEVLASQYDRLPREKQLQYVKLIHESGKTTYSLLENLLSWSRAQLNKIDFEPIDFDIREIVQENARLFQENLGIKQIRLKNQLQGEVLVHADKNMINTVVRNLISNAIKFTPAGGEITIRAIKENNNWVIGVSDTGIGMEEQDTQKLFRMDKSFSKEGTAGEKGTGLGLLLCKEFVEKNSGKIWVESTPGKGTTFWFSLPLSG